MGYFKAFVISDSETFRHPVTVCVRPVCGECRSLYEKNGFIVEDRPTMKFERRKCIECRKVRYVGGDLVDHRARRF